ncbi:phosphate ABC transporter permease PstA [Streptomyces sp. ACA25]|uniref:phosphate ABC transporter permease PstA n=1 Tax=Streptomyces sp. ACA25 TaxID=3022596 RepID=UPI0023072F6B|nr:phosphate ABC transporter permease PstA [Streptomyces sp. ACA25]MDB1088086.1 phosphate ABC transporter permease PstA [Streptomyces sp. ACA25]
MATKEKTPRTAERTRLAVAGARAASQGVFGRPSRSHRAANALFLALLLLGLGTALLGLVAILVWAFVEGSPRLDANLFFAGPSSVNPGEAGYRTAILGTLWLIGGVIALIVPIGVGAAVYLEEFADRDRWYNRVIELNIQNLAGVPSIVFGILGLAFIVRGPIGLGFVAAAGSLTLALLVLPTVILASREAIRAVPSSVRNGSLALGATLWQTIWRNVLPAATPGILTGVILAVARAIGEAAPLLLVGAVTFVTYDPQFLDGGYSALPVQIFNYASRPQEEFRVMAVAGVLVMLVVLLAINSFAIWLRNRYEQKW